MYNADSQLHSFHIPVMGTSYTIDSPIRVGKYGINSVVSIIDHRLIEVMREYHSKKLGLNYIPIPETDADCRAERIKTYLDFLDDVLQSQFDELKSSEFKKNSEIHKYFEMLPENSSLKQDFLKLTQLSKEQRIEAEDNLRSRIIPGRIDVNIMTKIDGNPEGLYAADEPNSAFYHDAHAALRGFAKSKICSSLVLSAGMNPRLFGYMATFHEFLPNAEGKFSKSIIVKVSDYRSALVQGKFLAKKGIWVSEFRIESGLNCGGHAFATEGLLLGPILQEFKDHRDDLISEMFEIYRSKMLDMNGYEPKLSDVRLSVQGGVGTTNEHNLLLEEFNMHSIGWGSPFLLVQEAVNIDDATQKLLASADESQFYLSNASPLGVHYNSIKNNSADQDRLKRISMNKPGSPCYKKHLATNTEYSKLPLCTASRKFQHKEIEKLKTTITDTEKLNAHIERVYEKVCLCVGLGNAALINAKTKMYPSMQGTAVCPGPNLAYFSELPSLKSMVDHIYGRINIVRHQNRPNLFLKELSLYCEFLKTRFHDIETGLSDSEYGASATFIKNLLSGIDYYKAQSKLISDSLNESLDSFMTQLDFFNSEVLKLQTVVLNSNRQLMSKV